MKSVIHPSNTRTLGAPEGHDQKRSRVAPLSVTDTDVRGIPAIISFWKPSEEELVVLNAGGTIALWVMGASMMPVALEVDESQTISPVR